MSDDTGQQFIVGDEVPGTVDDEFRFHFAILHGDYDGDHDVDDRDFLMYELGINSDGDGDTHLDSDDYQIWYDNNGELLPLGTAGADFDDNEVVDIDDLIRWQQGYGTDDFDGSGFLTWQRTYGNESAWFTGTPNFGDSTGAAISFGGLYPQVLNLIISGSASTHSPFGFDAVDGTGLQLGTVPVGGADTVSVVFSENVNVSANSLRVIGLRTFTVPEVAEFSYDVNTFTATWRFESWNTADHYLISVSDAVTDIDGNMLDGEWTNPANLFSTNSAISTFPFGDGTVGGVFNFVATILPGDANLDGIVAGSDFFILQGNWGLATGKVFGQGDFNGDGTVGAADSTILFSRWGTNLQVVSVLGDLNSDGTVDGLDIGILGDNFGMLTGATWADGDMDGDGDVDIDDLDLAYAQYGLEINLVA